MLIGGGSGAGKTAIATGLIAAVGPSAVLMPMDAYYRDRPAATATDRQTLNYDVPDAIELALLETHVRQLTVGRSVPRPVYDFHAHRRLDRSVLVPAGRLLVVEGIFALYWPSLRARADLSVFVDAPEETALTRRLARDASSRGRGEAEVRRQWAATVLPMHHRHVAPTRRFADLVISGTQPVTASVTRLLEVLRATG